MDESAPKKKPNILMIKAKRYLRKNKKSIRFWAITLSIALVVTVVLSALGIYYSYNHKDPVYNEIGGVSVELDGDKVVWNITGTVLIHEKETIVGGLSIYVGGNAAIEQFLEDIQDLATDFSSSTGSNAYLNPGDSIIFKINVKAKPWVSVSPGEQLIINFILYYNDKAIDTFDLNVDEYYNTVKSD